MQVKALSLTDCNEHKDSRDTKCQGEASLITHAGNTPEHNSRLNQQNDVNSKIFNEVYNLRYGVIIVEKRLPKLIEAQKTKKQTAMSLACSGI